MAERFAFDIAADLRRYAEAPISSKHAALHREAAGKLDDLIDCLTDAENARDEARAALARAEETAAAAEAYREADRQHHDEFHAAAQKVIADLAAVRNMLADCVVKATEYGTQDGEFVAMYLLPTGPIHRAIPYLDGVGINVRPGFDGRKALAAAAPAAPDELVELVEPDPTRTCPRCGTSWTAEIDACPHCQDAHPAACCDMHNRHCEPPGDLCCTKCTEAKHYTFPFPHADGSKCVLADAPAAPARDGGDCTAAIHGPACNGIHYAVAGAANEAEVKP